MSIDKARDRLATQRVVALMREAADGLETLLDARLSPAPVGDAYAQAITAGCYPLDDAPTPPAKDTEGEATLVSRLRNDGSSWAQPMFDEAADRIADLEARLAKETKYGEAATGRLATLLRNLDEARTVAAQNATRAKESDEIADNARKYCSAAAHDYEAMLTALENAGGTTLTEAFSKTAKEIRETSQFLQLVAAGQADGTVYDDELTKAKRALADATKRMEAAADELIQVSANSGSMKMPEARAHVLAALTALVPHHPLLSPASEGKTDG